jgi:hypothetical protein
MVKYAGKTLPLKVSGTIDAPSVLPDFSAILKQQVTDDAKERVRDRLRGLLNR